MGLGHGAILPVLRLQRVPYDHTGGGPEDFLFGAATNELADFYDVPLSMGAYATGAKSSDWQAGLENGLSSFLASATGSDMLLGAGLLLGYDAEARFGQCLAAWPADGPSKLMAERCRAMRGTAPPEDWDGSFEHLTKG